MTVYLAKVVTFNPNQKRDFHGRWTDGSPRPDMKADHAAAALLAGGHAAASAGEVHGLMTTLAKSPSVNLARLEIHGEPNLFKKHAREIPRSQMPQLPTRTEHLKEFTDALAERKITGEYKEVDPRSLIATQNELDSAKVGQIYERAKAGGINPNSIAFVSRDGHVLDGHHRWAGLAAANVTGDNHKMKVIQLDADIDTLLEIANTVSGERVGIGTNPVPGPPHGEGDPHNFGTKFDTPVASVGMTYSKAAADAPEVKHLKADAAAWDKVKTQDFDPSKNKIIATEEYLRSGPINKVVSGKVPFREGYDPHLLLTDAGYVVIDGHHRVAMYMALGRKNMPSKIIDARTGRRAA